MEPTPYLRNRRTGVILPYNEHLAKHPDMVACEELPYPKERHPPERPTTRRYMAKKAAAEKADKAEKAEKQAKPPPSIGKKDKPVPEAKSPGDAEIDDLLTGIEHG